MRWLRGRIPAAAAALVLVGTLAACDPPPPPVVLHVDTSMDLPDTAPGNGECDAVWAGIPFCSLRAAVEEAGASHVDRIEVSAMALQLASTLVVDPVAPTLTIARTQGTGRASVQRVGGSGPLVDVRGGGVVLSSTSLLGGPLRVGPGATAVVHDGVLSASDGDGVAVEGRAVLVASTVAGSGGDGASVAQGGELIASRAAIVGGDVGVRVATGGTARVTASTVSGARAAGVRNDGTTLLTSATVAASTVGIDGSVPVTAAASIVVGRGDDQACATPVASEGWNALGAGCGTPSGTDVAGLPEHLEPLSGSELPRHPISAAGAALVGLVPAGSGPCTAGAVDQLGVDRAADGSCTPGAVEGAAPAPLVVTSPADGHDAAPGDGTCATAAGACTLRAGLEEAAHAEDPTVRVAPGVDPVVDPTLGPIPADDVHLVGATGDDPTTIHAGGAPTLLTHCLGALLIEDLVLTGGGTTQRDGLIDAAGCAASPDPGGPIDLRRVTITGNEGIIVTGEMPYDAGLRLSIVDSDISDNEDYAVRGDFESVEVTRSTISRNDGGVLVDEHTDTVTITDSTISESWTAGVALTYGTISVVRSLISDHFGPGVSTAAGAALVVDSTVSGNGQGISMWSDPTVTVRRSTLAGNEVAVDGDWGLLRLAGSIIDGPAGCEVFDLTVVSEGWNVASDGSCGLSGPGDLEGTGALLGPLADNGGPTATHLPGPGSPALDAVPPGTADICAGPVTDQRGVDRPQGPACDRGAVEQ